MKKKILTIAAMKTKTLLTMLCAILLSCTSATAQDELPRQSIFLELGGPSNGLGLNYEQRLKNNPKWGWRAGASLGFSSADWIPGMLDASENAYTVSLGLNHLLGSKRSKLELGTGVNMGVYHTKTNFMGETYKEDNFGYYSYALAGWRYQSRRGFQFRAGLSPAFSFGGKYGLDGKFFCPYLSFGWAF